MNSKTAKKLRKILREKFESGDLQKIENEIVSYCNELLKKQKELQSENKVLCDVINFMREQQQTEAKEAIDEIPEVLK